jgi:hypothetical protein
MRNRRDVARRTAFLLLAALAGCGEEHHYAVDLQGNDRRVDADGHPLPDAVAQAPSNPHAGVPGAPQDMQQAMATAQAAKGAIAGTIELDPGLGIDPSRFTCVFIVARRAADGQMDGVTQLRPPVLPGTFQLAPADGQHGGGLSDGPHLLVARLDADGDAVASPGDVEATLEGVLPGGAPVTLHLAHVLSAQDIAARKAAAPPLPAAGGAPHGEAPFAPFAGGGMAERAPTPEDLAGPRFKGSVELAPEFAALDGKYTLYIIVRSAKTAGGAPLAPKRVDRARFPVSFDIGTESVPLDVDNKAEVLQGDLKVYARLSLSGNPIGQPGDVETEPVITSAGKDSIVLTLSKPRTP